MINVVTKLMCHQESAVQKMLPSRVGALFMDMGTGKSLTTIEIASIREKKGKINKVVWCCPVSLKRNTVKQILEHTDSKDESIHVFDAKTRDDNLPSCFWHVVGIESVGQSDRVVLALNALVDEKTMLVVDESSFIKGNRSKRTIRLIEIGKKAQYRLILTGTPISQGIEDLYSQMAFLSDKILGYKSWYSFRRAHLEYSQKYKGKIDARINTDYLAMRIAPYVYQVQKHECIDLPEKTESHNYVSLTTEQKKYYEEAKQIFFQDLLEYSEETPVAIYKLFGSLQLIVNGIVPSGYEGEGEPIETKKSQELVRIIGDIKHKHVVVWVKYVSSVRELSKTLLSNFTDINISLYYGELNESQKHTELERWRSLGGVLIATSSCGGYGLTLVESSYSIFYTNSFKYSERIQSEDRLHRIGQVESVHYVNIWCDCGIEGRIEKALERKSNALECFREEVEEVRHLGADAIKEMLKSL